MPQTYIRAVRPGAVGLISPVALSNTPRGRPLPGQPRDRRAGPGVHAATLPSSDDRPGGGEVGVVERHTRPPDGVARGGVVAVRLDVARVRDRRRAVPGRR